MSYHQESPNIKPDRRLRARSRSDYSTRRSSERFEVSFPVTIKVGSGENERIYNGTVRDISDGGLLIESDEIPENENRLKLAFDLPRGSMPEEYLHSTFKTEAEVRYKKDSMHGVQFTEPISKRMQRTTWRIMRGAAVLIFMLVVSAVLFSKYNNLYYFWFDVPIFFYSLLVGSFLLSRFLFSAFYQKAHPSDYEPTVSIVVPAHNEEEQIERTITQIMESAYPADKLQVIVVNDGSQDQTGAAIERARETYPEVISLSFEEAQGKRNALAAGYRVSNGEVIIFVDSDSFLSPSAIRNLMNRMADPDIAAATGHCEVENQWTNTLTRMQANRYYIAFRIMKAAESVFGAVTCLSGPLSAYRRDKLEEIFNEWLHQKFLGKPATFGDDRSLTNSLLRRGYNVAYESSACMTTYVPDDYRTFMRQQMRWKRSWFRESLRACSFMWKREPLMSLSFYIGFFLPVIAPLIVLRALVYTPLVLHASPLPYVWGVFLMSALMSSTYLFIKRSRLWIYGIHFCFFYMFVLVWQVPWALLTFSHNSWGTRNTKGEI